MEKDDEVKGTTGSSYTTEFRQYDPRLGRWLSLDPLMEIIPHMSPYVAFNNNPVYFIDPLGLKGGPADETLDLNFDSDDRGKVRKGSKNGIFRRKKERITRRPWKANPYTVDKPSISISYGVNPASEPNNDENPSASALFNEIGYAKDLINFYMTKYTGWGTESEPDFMTSVLYNRSPQNLGYISNFPVNGTFSYGLMEYKQKIFFEDQANKKFNLEAPGAGLLYSSYRFGFGGNLQLGVSGGIGIGPIVSSVRIPNYFGPAKGYSPGYRKKPNEDWRDIYRFRGVAEAAIIKIDVTYAHLTVFAHMSLTMYQWGNIKNLPIGEQSVPNYGIVGLVVGGQYNFQNRKLNK